MNQFLRIAIWNANGLANHCQELKLFITQQKLDVCLISETHFTDRSFFKIPDFNMYCTNHPDNRAHGGTAVLVRKKIKQYELPKVQDNYLQATSVVLEDGNNSPLALSAVYCPPPHIISKDQFVNFFSTLGLKFIAGGDYNAKHTHWGSRLINPRGRTLHKAITENALDCISSGHPTYWPTDPNKIPDLLDFCISKGISLNYIHIESSLDLSSDHTPVLISYSSNICLKEKNPSLCSKYTDWDLFKSKINSTINLKIPLKTTSDLEDSVNYFITTIQNAAWEATPQTDTSGTKSLSYPVFIKKKIAEKRRLRRIWQNSRNPVDKNRLNHAAQTLKRCLVNLKNKWFDNFTKTLTPTEATEYSLWKSTKYIKRPVQHVPPIQKNDGTWAKTNSEKAGVFSDYFSDVFQPIIPTPPNDESEIIEFLDSANQLSLPIVPCTPSEIVNVLRKEINPKKSPGYDFITGKVLKELPRKGIILLALIFNAILRLEYFPIQLKIAQLVVILKPGKPPNEASSYRPISLLPIVSKLFEKLILKRLNPIIDDLNLIPDHQFGFRKQHSTIEQTHRLVDIIKNAFESKKYCSAAFLDVQQAFDKVWHTGLLYKLKSSLPHSYYNLIKSYLNERFFQIKYENVLTDLKPIQSGVPQGSVLGPILYLIYTSDIPTGQNVTVATFADDTAILSVNDDPQVASNNLQNLLNEFQVWLQKWRVKVNVTKSSHITFTLRRENCPPVSLNNILLTEVESVKYLGVHIDRRLTWKNHIWSKRQQMELKVRKLNWLLCKNSKLSLVNKITLYKVMIKPIWTYGIQLWGTASTSNIEIIQRFQSKILRRLLDAPWFVSNRTIHLDLKIPTVKEEVTSISKMYQSKLENHPNNLAVNLLDNSEFIHRLKCFKVLDLSYRFS